uniref:Ovule protein n=1 Tax=Schistosoma mansoni TaxID=6183 RepID=A0A5K4F4X8_SCHMA
MLAISYLSKPKLHSQNRTSRLNMNICHHDEVKIRTTLIRLKEYQNETECSREDCEHQGICHRSRI